MRRGMEQHSSLAWVASFQQQLGPELTRAGMTFRTGLCLLTATCAFDTCVHTVGAFQVHCLCAAIKSYAAVLQAWAVSSMCPPC